MQLWRSRRRKMEARIGKAREREIWGMCASRKVKTGSNRRISIAEQTQIPTRVRTLSVGIKCLHFLLLLLLLFDE